MQSLELLLILLLLPRLVHKYMFLLLVVLFSMYCTHISFLLRFSDFVVDDPIGMLASSCVFSPPIAPFLVSKLKSACDSGAVAQASVVI